MIYFTNHFIVSLIKINLMYKQINYFQLKKNKILLISIEIINLIY